MRPSFLGHVVTDPAFPTLRTTVLDTTDARGLAEFYRELLGYDYRPGDEQPPAGEDDPKGRDWLVLRAIRPGAPRLAFQQVAELPALDVARAPRRRSRCTST